MSRDFEDSGPRPPRRKKPGSTPPPLPDSGPNGSAMEPSTFRPSPVGSGGSTKPRATRSGVNRDRSEKKTEIPAAGPTWTERILFGRVSSGQLAQFCRQFGTYLHSGIDFSRSLSSLEKQFARTALGPVIGRLQVAIRQRFDPGRRGGRGATDVRPHVRQHDQGRRGPRRRTRDLEDAGTALRGPTATDPPGTLSHDLSHHRLDHGRGLDRRDHRLRTAEDPGAHQDFPGKKELPGITVA